MSPSSSVIYLINPSFFTAGEMRRIFSEINVSMGGSTRLRGRGRGGRNAARGELDIFVFLNHNSVKSGQE